MKKFKTLFKRSFALFLAAVLCVSVSQITVFAEDASPTPSVSAIESADNVAKSNDVVEDGSGENVAGNTFDMVEVTKPESGAGDDIDSSKSPEPTPWTEEVGKEPNIVDVTVEPTMTITPEGTTVTWSGTGESEDGKLHGKVEGEETTTESIESTENKEIEIGDAEAGENGVDIEVIITTTGVDKNGVPKAPEGYGLKSDDGTTSVYTKVENDGTESEWIIVKNSQTDAEGKTVTTYQTTCGNETIEWRVEETKDSEGNVISTKTIKVVDENGEKKEEVVSSTSGKKIPVVTTDVLQAPRPEDGDGYSEPIETEEEGKKVLTYTKEVGDTTYKWIVAEIKDTDGKLIGYETIISEETTKTEPWSNGDSEQTLKPEVPEGYNPTSEEGVFQKTENGDVLSWKITEIKDEAGNIIGYRVVEVRPDVTVTTEEILVNGIKTTSMVKSTITKETVTDTKDGNVDVIVGVVTEGANHGNLTTKSLEPYMKWDPANGKTDITTDFFGWKDDQPYFVTAKSGLNIRKGPSTKYDKNGTVSTGETKIVTKTEVDANGRIWGCIGENQWICLSEDQEPYAKVPVPEGEDKFSFSGGYGLSSAITISYTGSNKGNKYNVHQFIVYDSDGKPHYAYCADLSVSPNKTDYSITNVENSGFFSNEKAEQISAIAVNGYWGTESGTGSLDAFKDWLVEIEFADSKQDLEWLSGGMAMSITQAAIWYYGSSGDLSIADNPFVYYEYDGKFYQYDRLPLVGVNTKGETQERVKAIYDYLITHSEEVKNSNHTPSSDLINSDSISKVSVSVGEKISDLPMPSNSANSNESTDVYSTDVSFYLDVKNSKINDDLIVNVFAADSGDLLYTYRLENAEDGNSRDSVRRGIIKPNKDGSYTLKDLQLGNGVEVTLQITGTQTVSKGAYLISATGGYDSSQTFISVEEGERSFDLKMNIKLDVQKGEATVKTETHEVNSNETKWSWGSESSIGYEYPDNPSNPDPNPGNSPNPDPDEPTPSSEEDPDDPVEDIPEDPVPLAEIPEDPVPLANIPNEEVPLANAPLSVELAEIPDEEVPLAGLTDIFDEEVPLADVPNTGDISVLWYVLILASGCGLLALRTADAKKRKNSLTR